MQLLYLAAAAPLLLVSFEFDFPMFVTVFRMFVYCSIILLFLFYLL